MTSSPLRRILAAVAVLACLPYLVLKSLWLLDVPLGITDPALMHDPALWALNFVTLAMDAVALALAFAFVTSWGRRLPALLVLLPMWIGSGLLGAVVVALPIQLVLAALVPAEPTPEPKLGLASWVYVVVYSGFAVLGLALMAGFALYARERWERVLTGRADAGRAAPGALTWTALVLCALTCAISVGELRSAGAALGVLPVVLMLTPVIGGAALLALTLGRPARLPVWVAVAGWFVASGVLGAWGGYLTVLSVVPNPVSGAASISVQTLLPALAMWAAGCALGIAGIGALRGPRVPS